MKVIKTANGFKRIEDWNVSLVSVQLRSILQEHRETLVDRLLTGDLESYIAYKFNTKVTHREILKIREKLYELKKSGIDLEIYRPIFEAVNKNEFTSLDNSIFYNEIDKEILMNLDSSPLFEDTRQFFFQ